MSLPTRETPDPKTRPSSSGLLRSSVSPDLLPQLALLRVVWAEGRGPGSPPTALWSPPSGDSQVRIHGADVHTGTTLVQYIHGPAPSPTDAPAARRSGRARVKQDS